jgi:flagellar basal-body rod modification protein FlgD
MKGSTLEEIRAASPPADDNKLQTRGNKELGKNEFLKLLMAQLAQQDPLSPTDSEAFVAQLAQFSALEMQQNANSTLEKLLISSAASQQASAINMVGKDVLYRADMAHLGEEGNVTVSADLSIDAASVTAVVEDESGKVVRTMQLGARTSGMNNVTWDGKDDKGNRLPEGSYRVRVTASDIGGNNIEVNQRVTGRVSGVSFEDGVPRLLVGNVRVNLSDVVEIKERKQEI